MSAHWILIHWLTTGGCAWRRCNELLFFLVDAEESLRHSRSDGNFPKLESVGSSIGSPVRSFYKVTSGLGNVVLAKGCCGT
jgi:hypothetical protein